MPTPIDFRTLTSAQKDALIVQLFERVDALTQQVQELQGTAAIAVSHRRVMATASLNRKAPAPKVASLQGVSRVTLGRR